ncbi:FGGY-family carbohydrate kinase [Rhodobacteraceae bacterium D3-12]|nr:FGGY-family carbohydrate kinase [Rhodobacteraceae bacterium D3-12]
MSHILAFDLGGSSLRLALVAPDGSFSAFSRTPLEITQTGQGQFEADPAIWWDAFVNSCGEMAQAGHDFSQVSAVAGCGFTRSQVFLDGAGSPLRPAITFQDARAAATLDTMKSTANTAVREQLQRLNPFDPLARLLWLKTTEPETWQKLRSVLEPKDFLNLQLTGHSASDRISQTPMARNLGSDPDDTLAALGIGADILPEQKSPFDSVGQVKAGLPFPLSEMANAPVYCGSFDTWSGVLGSGALRQGAAYSISGTSDVFGVMSDRHTTAEGLLTVEWGPNLWQIGGPSQGAATRLQWAMERFFPGAPRDEVLNAAFARTQAAPLFLPYLDGERTPLWDPDLSGAFLGVRSVHENADFVRGVAEGINYLAREVMDRAEQACGQPVSHVSFSGGMSGTPALCQLKADTLQRPVHVPCNHETGLVGAAHVARRAMTGNDELPVAFIEYLPDVSTRPYHDQRFAIFRAASEAVTPVSHQLNKIEPTGGA